MMAMQNPELILCTREIQKSIKESVHGLLSGRIKTHGLNSYYRVLDTEIRSKRNDSRFIFTGLSSVTEDQVKSTFEVNRAWVEEAQSLSESSIKILVPTIRANRSKLYYTYNRKMQRDPVHNFLNVFNMRYEKLQYTNEIGDKYYWKLGRCANAVHLHINYDGNPYFPDVLEKDRLRDREKMPLDEYKNVWQGMPLPQPEGSIIPIASIEDAVNRSPDFTGNWTIGVDVARGGKDSVTIAIKKGLAIKDIIEYRNKEKGQIMRIHETGMRVLRCVPSDDHTIPIVVDDTGLGGGLTDWLLERGYNAVGVNFQQKAKEENRYTNAISEMWFNMANIIEELSLPDDDELVEDLANRAEDNRDTRGRRRVEAKDKFKERFGRSPDKADAVLLACYMSSLGGVTIEAETLGYNIYA